MRILIINPNTSADMTKAIAATARKYARPETEIHTVNPSFGPRSIESHLEEVVAAHAVVDRILENRDNYDAFVIACFGDPGLYAAKELVEVPVIGIAEAALHFAAMLGHKFSILIPLPHLIPVQEDLARVYGLGEKLASVRVVNLPVLELESDANLTQKRLIEAGRKAIEEDGAEVLCLGCAGMALMDKAVEAALGVPVLDGTVCAVKIAEGMHDYGLKTSKVAKFKRPAPKEYVGCPRFYDSI